MRTGVVMPTEDVRRRQLLRIKSTATGLLVAAAVIYIVAWRSEHSGAPGWVGFVRAAAEAGLIGGLADWFAVTALFRHPLGLPIPHTAIVPTRKDALGRNLGDFIGTNFLNEAVVRDRLRRSEVAGRVGAWLAERTHAERVAAELAVAASSAMGVLRDEDVHAMLEKTIRQRLATVSFGPPLGRLLGQIVSERAHYRLVDIGAQRVHGWLLANRALITGVVISQAPLWSPDFVDQRVAGRIYAEVVRISGEVADDRRHPLRQTLDTFLGTLADDLRENPTLIKRVDDVAWRLLDRPDVRRAFGDLVTAGRALLLELIEDPSSELRVRGVDALVSLGRRLSTEAAVSGRVNGWIEGAVIHIVTNYREELTKTITDTVERWDAHEASRKIELAVGRDLQFIRINGTVVGALAGLAIHAVTLLL